MRSLSVSCVFRLDPPVSQTKDVVEPVEYASHRYILCLRAVNSNSRGNEPKKVHCGVMSDDSFWVLFSDAGDKVKMFKRRSNGCQKNSK